MPLGETDIEMRGLPISYVERTWTSVMFTCELQYVFRSPDGRIHSTSTDLARPTTGPEPMQFQLTSSLKNVFEA